MEVKIDNNYMVKSYYTAMAQGPEIRGKIGNLWQIKAPQRVLVFSWLLLHKKILMIDNLIWRGRIIPNICYFCWHTNESIQHIFAQCLLLIFTMQEVANQGLQLPSCQYLLCNLERTMFTYIRRTT